MSFWVSVTYPSCFDVLPGGNCHLRYLYKKIEAPNIIIALIACNSVDVFTSSFNLVVVHRISIEDDHACQNVTCVGSMKLALEETDCKNAEEREEKQGRANLCCKTDGKQWQCKRGVWNMIHEALICWVSNATAHTYIDSECFQSLPSTSLAPPTVLQFAKTRKLSIERSDSRKSHPSRRWNESRDAREGQFFSRNMATPDLPCVSQDFTRNYSEPVHSGSKRP